MLKLKIILKRKLMKYPQRKLSMIKIKKDYLKLWKDWMWRLRWGISEFRDLKEIHQRRIWNWTCDLNYWNLSEKIKLESEDIVENDTKLKEEKAKIDNHCKEENVKEKVYKVSQSKLQGLSPGKRMYELWHP